VYGTNGLGTGIYVVNPAGTTCAYHATGTGPYGAATDGASNIWVTNRTAGTITGLNYLTGAKLSSTNLQPVNQFSTTPASAAYNLLNDPMNIAVDISGDVFVTNFNGNSIVELIGLTTPLYGPLGVAAGGGTSKIGTTP
jgi:hypothetical protein